MKFKSVKKKDLFFNDQSDFQLSDDRSFTGIAYSGNVIKNHPFWGDLIFDISTMTSKKRIPILSNHDMDKIIGSGKLSFTDHVSVQGTISKTTKYGLEAFALIKEEDFPMQESVYIEPESIRNLQKGEKATINGQQLVGPATIFIGGKIKEVSLTPLGADSETSTTVFNSEEIIKIMEENMDENMEENMDEQLNKFSEIFAKSPKEAFEFACSCQKTEEKASDEDKDLKIDELTKQLSEALDKISKMESSAKEKASLERKAKIEKVFSDLMITLNPEIQESYLEMSDEKFSKVISSLEADALAFSEKKKEELKKLITYQEPAKTDEIADEQKLFSLAREIRKQNPSMAVATSLEEARKSLKK